MTDKLTAPEQPDATRSLIGGPAAGYQGEPETPPEAPPNPRERWREGYSFGRQIRSDYAARR